MSFPARFPGKCSKCLGPIERGQLISWNRKQKGIAWHSNCESPNDTPAESTPTLETHPATLEVHQEPTPHNGNGAAQKDLFSLLGSALSPYLDSPKATVDEAQVRAIVAEELASRGATPITIHITRDDKPPIEIKSAHALLPKLIKLVQVREHVYLYGDPGSGKSTAAHQVSIALDRPYGFISLNPQTPDSRLMGFLDVNRVFSDPVFFRIVTGGGIFCIDEVDNASASLLTTLNSLLENGHAAFPNGVFPVHPDFQLIATGNTAGRGANPLFPERRPFDAAFAERFIFMHWPYDEALESALVLANNPKGTPWLTWIRNVRTMAKANNYRLIVSPRAAFRGAKLLAMGYSPAEAADAVLWKGLDPSTVAAITSTHPYPEVN